mgnify:CR=1 FL=1
MKIQFRMTVSGVVREDGGVHAAALWNGGESAALIRPIAKHEAEALAPLYGKQGAIRVTFDTGEDSGGYDALTREDRDTGSKLQEHRGAHVYLDTLRAPRELHGAALSIAERIARIPRDAAPPLKRGRPCCCADAMRYDVSLVSEGTVWVIRARNSMVVRFCPFCGAKLPEVTP